MKTIKEIIEQKNELDMTIREAQNKIDGLPKQYYDYFTQEYKGGFDVVFGAEILENTQGTLAEKWGVQPNTPTEIDKGLVLTVSGNTTNRLITIPRDASLSRVYVPEVTAKSLSGLYKKYGLDVEVISLPEKTECDMLEQSAKERIKFIGFCYGCYRWNYEDYNNIAEKLSTKGRVSEFYALKSNGDKDLITVYTPVGKLDLSRNKQDLGRD